ncbi:4761_t:CDS:2 [Cetraspora pellucida]|uniref:4761_t:CDS:1 n=1 Tax=Cetraspora pellucida TaxID=1433469 RepID=A0A9N9BZN6_9GLOM|nr:4761_t:CDS:2 [Cetraspora pellucida]
MYIRALLLWDIWNANLVIQSYSRAQNYYLVINNKSVSTASSVSLDRLLNVTIFSDHSTFGLIFDVRCVPQVFRIRK